MSFSDQFTVRDRYFPDDLPTDAQLNEALQRAGITRCFNAPYPWAPDYDTAKHRKTFDAFGAASEALQDVRNAKRR